MAQPETLPEGYHLENFFTLLQYVETTYDDLLTQEEKSFLKRYSDLSAAARSLYVRLVMRKGPLFRTDSLNYQDVPQLKMTLKELAQANFIAIEPDTDTEQLLQLLTKPELLKLFNPLCSLTAAVSKSQLIATITSSLAADEVRNVIKNILTWVARQHDRLVRRMLLLFFGNGRQGLSEFITTQLGIVQYEQYPITVESRFFKKRHRLDILEKLIDIQDWMEENLSNGDSEALLEHHQRTVGLLLESKNSDDYLSHKAERIITHLSRQLERLDMDSALPAYSYSIHPPSRERQARILEKQNKFESALDMITDIENYPQHPDETDAITALKKRLLKKLNISAQSEPNIEGTLKQIPTQHLTLENGETNIENIVALHLSDAHNLCLHLENHLFCGLFGLFFWDIIFAPEANAFFNPYQLGPRDLWSADFYKKRQQMIDQRLAMLRLTNSFDSNENSQWRAIFVDHHQQKQGLANYFVNWSVWSETLLEAVLEAIPASHLAAIFAKMLENPGYYRSGFPDLLLISENHYQLWEVKGPTDKLQSNQKRWLAFFKKQHIPAGVIQVQWQTE